VSVLVILVILDIIPQEELTDYPPKFIVIFTIKPQIMNIMAGYGLIDDEQCKLN